jgi:hypothetical protein
VTELDRLIARLPEEVRLLCEALPCQADRPTLITAIALCQTARDNDHARLAHLIAEGSDPEVQAAYRRGAERAQAAMDLLARLAAAIPRTP